ncbi:Gfo/Idh/MocA family protein [Paenarthrobacter aurescens]|uniref:Oxidoreductase n=1 Tax=Paenarthrobacter aurescens TaxID=43663 RepID=A0A4Y3NEE3_PAEAU|nr:Gfo/Idh/MocA family oxidoreductase [Paenarthrobacter aurescens]MDO6144803.1 Gfo/Idh/MocA family oxidoreductase [Paenarthrobacter aurescens]MDO6148648.1 Gfo/Idh/MocA family oxidoreductase [Paenarthrobacter aurescens]MDO6159894.1 Gfo/Idh/MocA family oxidoreductase [Paenarthrobacter aurescens]MDO6163753.1 Gfo/Idh/MocA family oxidoreductase [Paenarthrobacter aurescens]GEB17536.1 oxidoreductase [Paenarthrobacter aurescens]
MTSPATAPRTFRVGIAGCGAISRNHLEAFHALKNVKIVGVCDVDEERARATAEAWGVPNAVTSVEELLNLGLDIVSVCTPHPTHEEVVLQAAAAGVNVLCEKPIATKLESAERMVAACENAGVQLGVLFQRRFWPASQKIRTAIDDGTLGRAIMAQCSVMLHRAPDYYNRDAWRGTWESDGGGVLMSQAVHQIDLLQWYLGDVAEVYGKVNTYRHGDFIEVEDSATAVITFTSGAMATLQASTAVSPNLGIQLRITGETGASASLTEFPEGSDGRLDLWAVGERIVVEPVHPEGVEPNVDLSIINGQLIPFHKLQVQDFVQALENRTEPAITGKDALKSLRILLAVYESSRTGAPVRFAPGHPAHTAIPERRIRQKVAG